MEFLKELLTLTESMDDKKKKKKKDKSADKFFTYVAGNMLFKNVCSGELAGTMKSKK